MVISPALTESEYFVNEFEFSCLYSSTLASCLSSLEYSLLMRMWIASKNYLCIVHRNKYTGAAEKSRLHIQQETACMEDSACIGCQAQCSA